MARGLCSRCDKQIVVNRNSRPDPVCHECRRRAWGLDPDQKVKVWRDLARQTADRLTHCRRCDGPVPDDRRSYCSTACARKRQTRTGARGYGKDHQKLRAQMLPQAYGQDCHLCGAVMLPSQDLHLDHTPDRTGYRGMAHAWCNSLDGLHRAQEALRRKRLGVSA